MNISYVEVTFKEAKLVNNLIEFAQDTSPDGKVETQKDWAVVIALWEFWKASRPQEYKEFKESVNKYREAYIVNKHGAAQGTGGAQLQHLIEYPPIFYMLLKSFFPEQRFDRDFARKIIVEIPELRLHRDSKI